MSHKDLSVRKEYSHQYYKKHKKEANARAAKYRISHKEEIHARWKKWKKGNPEMAKQIRKKWLLSHSENRRFKWRRYMNQKKSNGGSHTKQQWEDLKEQAIHCCAICGMQEPFVNQMYPNLTEDHIVPLSKGGSNDISNIQPLCFDCNRIKSNKI
jgi:5-methylcytosine-specific restriction endonuclease McrA